MFVLALNANAQWLSFGVTGGVPITPQSATYSPATINFNPTSLPQTSGDVYFQAPNDFYQKPYAVGPELEINLPWNLSLQAGMLYERFHQDVSEGLTVPHGSAPNFGYITSVAANAFAFPLLAKYNFGHHRVKPFIEAGATLRHLNDFYGEGLQLDILFRPSAVAFQFDPEKAVDVAITAGGGFRYRVAMVDLVPEIRYLHWTARYEQPVQNQAMLTLTIAFPARR